MANVLKVAMKNSIITLYEKGHSQRAIRRMLGVDRKTIRRYLRLYAEEKADPPVDSDRTISTAGTGAGPVSKSPIPTAGSGIESPSPKSPISTAGSPGRRSDCEPFREIIEEKVQAGLSAQRIWQDLDDYEEFTASYQSVKRFVRKFEERMELPFRRMEAAPGTEAQIDFGRGAFIVDENGKRTRPHLFRMILSHSGAGYSEVVRRQNTETFIRCIENGLRYFGGVPEALVIDNLKAAVTRADWYDPDIHPKFRDFCQHYGTVVLPTRPRTPRHKGKVEKSIDYVQSNALKGRTFSSLADQNRFLAEWETKVADTRIHGTTRRQVRQALEAEREHLGPLPDSLFPFFKEAQRKINRDGHVEVDHAYYSVPPEYGRSKVWVRWDGRIVRIFTGSFKEIAVHAAHEPGRFSTLPGHISARKISGIERGEGWMMGKIRLIGPQAEAWARAVMTNRGIEGLRVLQGLLSLTSKYRSKQIDTGCRESLHAQQFRLKSVKEAIRSLQHQPELFAEEHPLIRSIDRYGCLVPFPGNEEGT